jgi:cell division septum initiation protein DivIVA
MARLTDEDKESILAEFHTGVYSNNELAKRWNTSHTTVNKIVKDLKPKNSGIVSSQIANRTELAEQSFKEVSAVETAVKEKTKHLEYINNLTLKNLSVMAKKINEDTTIAEHKMISEAVDKSAITLKVAERHAPKMEVKQELNQTDVKVIAVEYS